MSIWKGPRRDDIGMLYIGATWGQHCSWGLRRDRLERLLNPPPSSWRDMLVSQESAQLAQLAQLALFTYSPTPCHNSTPSILNGYPSTSSLVRW